MAFDQIGLEAILEGVGDFISDGESLNDTVASMGGAFDMGASLIAGAGGLIGDALGGLASAALDLASSAGSALIDFFGDSFAGALEAEQTIARLGQVIESTGGAAGVTVGEAEALADQFKGLAGGSDDAVLSIIDMGLRMGTISEEEMPAFIQSTLDLGAVMGDAGKAAQLMARAQEDPVGVLGALRKAGILVNEETEAQIKAMVKAGDTAGAYSLLMGRVGEATQGAADTMANTAAGQWAIFTETIADAGESIAMAFLPTLNTLMQSVLVPMIPVIEQIATAFGLFFETLLSGDVGGAFDILGEFDVIRGILQGLGIDVYALGTFFQGLYDFVVANIPLVQTTFETVFTAIQTVFQALSDFVTVTLMPAIATIWEQTGIQLPTAQQTFESVMTGIVIATKTVSDFITNVLVPVMTAAVDWVVANWPAIQATAIEVWTQVQAAINTAVTFIQGLLDAFLPQITANVSTTLAGLTAFWDAHGAEIMAIVENTFGNIATFISITLAAIGATLSTALTLASGLIASTMQIINGDWEGAWDTISDTTATALDGILSLVGQDLDSFTSIWTTNWNMANTLVSAAWNSIKLTIANAGLGIIGTVQGIVGNIGAVFFNAIQMFVDLGAAIILGVQTGIANAVGGLVNAAVQAAQDAYNAARNALGISSPSVLFMGLGESTMEGMALGISNETSTATRAAVSGAEAVVDRVRGVLVRAQPMIEQAAENVGASISRGMGLQQVCNEVAKEAEKIGSQCIPAGIQRGLGLLSRDISGIMSRGILPHTGGTSTGSRGISPLPVSTQPVSTGGITAEGGSRMVSNTYQYSPTYSAAPMSPERDFALMQVLAGV